MFARNLTFHLKSNTHSDYSRILENDVLPLLRRQKGFNNPPNFLVLDEPTNHLDLATKEMLVDALKTFEGTMIFVSHDRMFLRDLGSRVLLAQTRFCL